MLKYSKVYSSILMIMDNQMHFLINVKMEISDIKRHGVVSTFEVILAEYSLCSLWMNHASEQMICGTNFEWIILWNWHSQWFSRPNNYSKWLFGVSVSIFCTTQQNMYIDKNKGKNFTSFFFLLWSNHNMLQICFYCVIHDCINTNKMQECLHMYKFSHFLSYMGSLRGDHSLTASWEL